MSPVTNPSRKLCGKRAINNLSFTTLKFAFFANFINTFVLLNYHLLTHLQSRIKSPTSPI